MDKLRSITKGFQESGWHFYPKGSESDFKSNGRVNVNFKLVAARPACGAVTGTFTVSCVVVMGQRDGLKETLKTIWFSAFLWVTH